MNDNILLEAKHIGAAYKKLSADERARLDEAATVLKTGLHERKQKVYPGSGREHIGEKFLLELMGKLGMWLVENGDGE